MWITRSYAFDAGHRVMRHGGKCAHLHGHRYEVELAVEGDVVYEHSSEVHGMVVDFGTLKSTLEHVCEPFDHALLLEVRDVRFLEMYYVDCDVRNWQEKETTEQYWLRIYETRGMFPFAHQRPETVWPGPSKKRHRLVLLEESPTAENLAQHILDACCRWMTFKNIDWKSAKLRLYETPNCWADAVQSRVVE